MDEIQARVAEAMLGVISLKNLLVLATSCCDGGTMAVLGAAQLGIEALLLGQVPDAPQVTLVHPALAEITRLIDVLSA